MRLYELRAEYEQALEAAIDPETGEVRDAELDALLDEVEAKLEEKALDVAAYIVNLEAEAKAIATRASEMSNRAAAIDNRADGLRRYLAKHLTVGTKLADDRVAIGWRRSMRTDLIVEHDALPERWRRVLGWVPDIAGLRDALKAGDPEAAKYAHTEVRHNLQVT